MSGDANLVKLSASLKGFWQKDEVVKDNLLFRLYSVFTALLLFGFSIVATLYPLIGVPMTCMGPDEYSKEELKAIETYCWMLPTFTEVRSKSATDIHPGVGSIRDWGLRKSLQIPRKYYSYYRWVFFALFMQGVACYFPKWLWNYLEGGLMKALVAGLNHFVHVPREKDIKKKALVRYVLEHTEMHRTYAKLYWLCECLCFAGVFTQLYLLNLFFNGDLLRYGLNLLSISNQDYSRVDSLILIFPRVTKCEFLIFGVSGEIKILDFLCLLSHNVINEKVFIFIWFWFILMAVLLTLLMLFRLFLIVFPSSRPRFLKSARKMVSRQDVRIISSRLGFGGWWLLYMLGQNLHRTAYNEVLVDLAAEVRKWNVELKNET